MSHQPEPGHGSEPRQEGTQHLAVSPARRTSLFVRSPDPCCVARLLSMVTLLHEQTPPVGVASYTRGVNTAKAMRVSVSIMTTSRLEAWHSAPAGSWAVLAIHKGVLMGSQSFG